MNSVDVKGYTVVLYVALCHLKVNNWSTVRFQKEGADANK